MIGISNLKYTNEVTAKYNRYANAARYLCELSFLKKMSANLRIIKRKKKLEIR